MHPQDGKSGGDDSLDTPRQQESIQGHPTETSASRDTTTPRQHHVRSAASGSASFQRSSGQTTSTATGIPIGLSTENHTRLNRPVASDTRPSSPEQPLNLSAVLSQLGQVADKREIEYQDKIERLRKHLSEKEDHIARLKISELNYCAAAKMYKQDRNYVLFRLASLEKEVNQRLRTKYGHTRLDGRAARNTAEKSKEPTKALSNPDLMAVGQKITRLVDDMTKTPVIKDASNSSHPGEKGGMRRIDSALPSIWEQSDSPSTCSCGCQEQMRALKARCEYAENYSAILEVRCEKYKQTNESYKAKWVQWKEAVVREQQVKRMRGHQHTADSGEMHNTPSPLSRHTQRPMSRTGQVHFGPVQVTTLPSDDSDSASQRSETTRQNTFFNRFMDQPPTSFSILVDQPAFANSSSHGKGSQMEPHVLDDDEETVGAELEAKLESSDKDRAMSPSLRPDDDSYEDRRNSPILSPTFPSEIELCRRRALSEGLSVLDTDKAGDGDGDDGDDKEYVSQQQQQREEQEYQIAQEQYQQPVSGSACKRPQDFSLPSDHSSPPMFDPEEDDAAEKMMPPPPPPRRFGATITVKNTVAVNKIATTTTSEEIVGTVRTVGDISTRKSSKQVVNNGNRWHQTNTKRGRDTIDARQEELDFLNDGNNAVARDDVIANADVAAPSERQANSAYPAERVYNFTERRKDKRKQMHGSDCPCCRRFYEITGPLPLPDGYNQFFTPAPRPGETEIWEQTNEERLNQRIQSVSRHRVQHEVPLTPPGFWDTDFPPTPERKKWDQIALERKDRKKQRT
ncbi:hypothetical protein BG004_007145 [Podila humilis]|nr:hypothetical protein BG004_007145 [Podila humilis]